MHEPMKLNFRHQEMMDLMIACPWMNKKQIAETLNMTPQSIYDVTGSELFALAFDEYRKRHSEKICDLAAEATIEAIKFERDVVRGRVLDPDGNEVIIKDTTLRQISARDILSLGHAKAIEKRISVEATLEDALRVIQEKKEKGSLSTIQVGSGSGSGSGQESSSVVGE